MISAEHSPFSLVRLTPTLHQRFHHVYTATTLSSDGHTLAIGGKGSLGPGGVEVYRLYSKIWIKLGETIKGVADYDRFGMSVDLSADGNTLVAGGDGYDGGGNSKGVVRVYTYVSLSEGWVLKGKELVGSSQYDRVGWVVSISDNGETVAYGAADGYTEVFSWERTKWSQLGKTLKLGSSAGRSLALSSDGKIMAVGSSGDSNLRVYQYSNKSWDQRGDVIRGQQNSNAGSAIAISGSGDIVTFGAPLFSSNAGKVQTVRWTGKAWVVIGIDLEGDYPEDYFGTAVALSKDGQTVAVAAPGDSNGLSNPWYVRVYTYTDTGRGWVRRGSEIRGDDDSFGTVRGGPNLSISLSDAGNILAVGSALNDERGDNRGKTLVYHFS